MRSSHFGQVLQRRFLLEAHADNATMAIITANPIFTLTVIDSQLYCEYKGYHGRQLDTHYIDAYRTRRLDLDSDSTACPYGFPGRKRLPLAFTRLVYSNNDLYFSLEIQPIQS